MGRGAGRQELVGLGCLAPQRMGFCYHFSLCLRLDWDWLTSETQLVHPGLGGAGLRAPELTSSC